MIAQELELDYFKIYVVLEHQVDYDVFLKGQFDEEFEPATLRSLAFFANPVSKNGQPYYCETAHLACYSLYQPRPEPMRRVEVENQFGRQKITIGQPCALLVPAEKGRRELELPEKLAHFKLYWVLEGERPTRDEALHLSDQFGEQREVWLAEPIAFGVPVAKKTIDGQVSHVQNERAHLLVYRIPPRLSLQAKVVVDQFRSRYLHFFYSLALAVPGIKHGVSEE